MILEHNKLVETAFATYLQNLNPNPWPNTLSTIATGEINTPIQAQNIVCWVNGDSEQEDPPLSGNRYHDCFVRLRTPVIRDDTGNAQYNAHVACAAALQIALVVTGLELLLSAAIPNFTCFGIVEHTPFSQQTEEDWEAGYKMRIYSCASTFPN